MKTRMVLMILGLLTVPALADPPRPGMGLGIMVGEPTGLSLKTWVGDDRAVDVGLAWSFSDHQSFHVHADYLLHRFDAWTPAKGGARLPLYFGLGARLKLGDDGEGRGNDEEDARIGLRVPFGLAYLFAEAPAELFAEVAPILDVVPDTELAVNAAIGVRFYF